MVRRIRRVVALSVVTALTAVLVAAFSTVTAPPAGAAAAPALAPARSYVLVDVDTGRVLAEQNSHNLELPASTMKLLTALTALEHLSLDSTVVASQLAADRPTLKMGIVAGEKWRVLDAMGALLIVSANDIAYMLAEASSGTVEQFAQDMAATAARLGIKDGSTFADPAGLDTTGSVFPVPGRMSAYDMAVIARNAMAVPVISGFASMREHRFTDLSGRARRLPGHNAFIRLYPGATGLKTGYTKAASNTLVASATRDGRTMLAVVFGAADTIGWATRLLDQGFATPANAAGTGETLPEVRARTLDGAKALIETLPRAMGRPDLGAAAGTADPTPAPAGSGTAAAGTGAAASSGAKASARDSGSGSSGSGSSGGSVPIWLVAVPVLLVVAIAMLRMRVVVRRRRRRRRETGAPRSPGAPATTSQGPPTDVDVGQDTVSPRSAAKAGPANARVVASVTVPARAPVVAGRQEH